MGRAHTARYLSALPAVPQRAEFLAQSRTVPGCSEQPRAVRAVQAEVLQQAHVRCLSRAKGQRLAATRELGRVQDRIEPFSTEEARALVEQDLGAPIDTVFSAFSAEPIAAASLAQVRSASPALVQRPRRSCYTTAPRALPPGGVRHVSACPRGEAPACLAGVSLPTVWLQVYRATVRETGAEVAVKVQRPGALSTISKDLYVLRRGIGVYEAVVKRFTAQTTDYQELLSTFAEGLYTEMDFRNEALNMVRMQQLLDASEFATADILIPPPDLSLTTRRCASACAPGAAAAWAPVDVDGGPSATCAPPCLRVGRVLCLVGYSPLD